MADIYDDPTLKDEDDDDFITMEKVGDGVQGVVQDIQKITTKFGPCLKYTVKLDSNGKAATFLGVGKNLRGQLMSMKPRPGDHLDIRLVELRPTALSDLKVYEVTVTPPPAGVPAPVPIRTPGTGAPDDEDLFAS